MEQQEVLKMVSENMKTIFAYSLSRLSNRQESEDLANDIIVEILKSGANVKNDKAFYGFMWSIANNTYKKFLRKNKNKTEEFDEAFVGTYWFIPEEDISNNEEVNALRRELSLLSSGYRQATVLYYIYNKSCFEISQQMNVSTEMVKYYLFKTRKILKEGIGMTREFGEKSYNPAMFRMDYWGNGDNSAFWKLFDRKLPGNILLSAYYYPQTITELSVELGVSTAYLEDEIDILVKHEVLKVLPKGKYQTNIIIFTSECEKEIKSKIVPIYQEMADKVYGQLVNIEPAARKIDFKGNDYNQNKFLWAICNLAMFFGLNIADGKQRKRFGDYPLLSDGSYGFVFGYDNDYKYHHYNGIYGHCDNKENTAYISVINYRVIEKCQKWQPEVWDKNIEAMTLAVLEKETTEENEMLIKMIEEGFIISSGGKLSANFPVFKQDKFNEMWELLKPIAEDIKNCIVEICNISGEILKSHAPKVLIEHCEQLAFIKYQVDVMAFIVETMVEKGYLKVSDSNEKLAVFGVIK